MKLRKLFALQPTLDKIPAMKHLIFMLLLAGCVTVQTGPGRTQSNMFVPTHQGWATPTPTTPIRDIKGLIGSIPANTPETLRLYVNSYNDIAFETEFNQGTDPWVRKFNSPVKYVFRNFGSEHVRVWRDVAHTLEKVTGIQMSLVQHIQSGELPYANRPVTVPLERGAVVIQGYENRPNFCFAVLVTEPDDNIHNGVIFGASVMVGQGNFTTRECLIEEMAQLMGLPNDSDIVSGSLFRKTTVAKTSWLTWHDAIMLRTLYDERLKPGMHQTEAMPIVKVIIGELLEELNRPS